MISIFLLFFPFQLKRELKAKLERKVKDAKECRTNGKAELKVAKKIKKLTVERNSLRDEIKSLLDERNNLLLLKDGDLPSFFKEAFPGERKYFF